MPSRFAGLRHRALRRHPLTHEEFGPIISAGLGGVEMELLARQTRKGAAVAIAPTGTVDGEQFFQLFRNTLSYDRLSGAMRGSRRLLDDAILIECFQAFIDLANHFSAMNPDAAIPPRGGGGQPLRRLRGPDGAARRRLLVPAGHAPPPVRDRSTRSAASSNRESAAIIGVSETQPEHGPDHPRQHPRCRIRPRPASTSSIRPPSEIDGVPCVASVAICPTKVDLFVVAVGADQVARRSSTISSSTTRPTP